MRYLFFLILFFSTTAQAQWKSFMIGPKGDTLNRVDAKGSKQGPWVIREETVRGERGYEEEGFFLNNQREGTWRRFSLEGDLIAVENYRWGQKNGKNTYFNPSGEPIREEAWRAVNPQSPYDTVPIRDVNDPNKILRFEIMKVEPVAQRHGTWRFYDVYSGRIEKTEQYAFDKIKLKEDEDLVPIGISDDTTTTTAKKPAPKEKVKPKEVMEFEKKNSGKKKVKMRDGATGG